MSVATSVHAREPSLEFRFIPETAKLTADFDIRNQAQFTKWTAEPALRFVIRNDGQRSCKATLNNTALAAARVRVVRDVMSKRFAVLQYRSLDDELDLISQCAWVSGDTIQIVPTVESLKKNGQCQGDADGDSVKDCNDVCPFRGDLGYIDRKGCDHHLHDGMTMYPRYEVGQVELNAEMFREVDNSIRAFSKYPDLRVDVVGHTSMCTTENERQSISDARAQVLASVLLRHGIHPHQINRVWGAADSLPLSSAKSCSQARSNERVEMNVRPSTKMDGASSQIQPRFTNAILLYLHREQMLPNAAQSAQLAGAVDRFPGAKVTLSANTQWCHGYSDSKSDVHYRVIAADLMAMGVKQSNIVADFNSQLPQLLTEKCYDNENAFLVTFEQ